MMHRSLRRGFTLVELLAAMALVAVLFALISLFVSASLQAHRQSMLRERQRLEFLRLDTILRTDGHAATAVELKSPTECELRNAAGERWTYRATEAELVRERFQGAERKQQELFFLRTGTKVEFKVAHVGDRSLLQLQLEPPRETGKSAAFQAPYRGQVLLGGALAAERRPAAAVVEEKP